MCCDKQHLQDILDVNMTALDWMLKAYPEVKEREDMRRIIGRYGLTGSQQVSRCFTIKWIVHCGLADTMWGHFGLFCFLWLLLASPSFSLLYHATLLQPIHSVAKV